MLLTDCEREFLAAFVHEVTTDPFKGPATDELHKRDIYYTDLSYLMAAYYRENVGDQEGFGGKHNPTPPPCPWTDRELDKFAERLESLLLQLENRFGPLPPAVRQRVEALSPEELRKLQLDFVNAHSFKDLRLEE